MRPIDIACLALPLVPDVVEVSFPPGLAITPLPGRTGALLGAAAGLLAGDGEAARPFDAECEGLVKNTKQAAAPNANSTAILFMTNVP